MNGYAVSPVDELDIVKVKRYLISNWDPCNGRYGSFSIVDDEVVKLYCLIGTGCAHLGNETWTIIEEEEPSNDH